MKWIYVLPVISFLFLYELNDHFMIFCGTGILIKFFGEIGTILTSNL